MHSDFYTFDLRLSNRGQAIRDPHPINLRFLMHLLAQRQVLIDSPLWGESMGVTSPLKTIAEFSSSRNKDLFEFSLAQVIGTSLYQHTYVDQNPFQKLQILNGLLHNLPEQTIDQYHEFYAQALQVKLTESITSTLSPQNMNRIAEHGQLIYSVTHQVKEALASAIGDEDANYQGFCHHLFKKCDGFDFTREKCQIYCLLWDLIIFYHDCQYNIDNLDIVGKQQLFVQKLYGIVDFLATAQLDCNGDPRLLSSVVFSGITGGDLTEQRALSKLRHVSAILYASIAGDAWRMLSPILFDNTPLPCNASGLNNIGKMLLSEQFLELPLFYHVMPLSDDDKMVINALLPHETNYV